MNRVEHSHIWEKEKNEHYVETRWVWPRFFEVETMTGTVCDPCAGFGRSVTAARAVGLDAFGCDVVDRGFDYLAIADFGTSDIRADNFVMNPPFSLGREFVERALRLASRKVAAILPMRRLAAAGKWVEALPHYRTYYITPRPSMPPGHVALEYERAGKEPSGGKQDFCILVFLKGFNGDPTEHWLRRPPRPRRLSP